MKNDLTCGLVRDLLPSYVDELTGEESNEAIERHLSGCPQCRKVLESMRDIQPDAAETKAEKKEIDFLKTTRKKTRHRIFGAAAAAAVLVIAVLGIKFFVIGSPVYEGNVATTVAVDGSSVRITATALDDSVGISDIQVEEEDGVLTISYDGTLASFFHKGTVSTDYTASGDVTDIYVGDRVIYSHGMDITAAAAKLYAAKTEYCGDHIAVGQVARLLGVYNTFGEYDSEMINSSLPYDWRITITDPVTDMTKDETESRLTYFGSVMLSLIGNLDQVTFTYTIEGTTSTLVIDTAAADAFAGTSIKSCADTAADLQKLLDLGSMSYTGDEVSEGEAGVLKVNILNQAEDEIFDLGYAFASGENDLGSGDMINADGSDIAPGEVMTLDVDYAMVGEDIPEDAPVAMVLSVDGTMLDSTDLPAVFGETCTYILSGSAREGYKLTLQSSE